MFKDVREQRKYIQDNFPKVTDQRIDENHWDLHCPRCKTVRGFQVVTRSNGQVPTGYQSYAIDLSAPTTIYFRCPVCKSYKQWIVYNQTDVDADGVKTSNWYRVASLPSEGIEDISELPSNPPALRIAYQQAIRSMDANAHIAAAAMFRRALQVITRQILEAPPGTLASELRNVVGKKYDGVTITNDFSTFGYIIKEAGNQGAHPDADPDLLDFTAEDSQDLQNIFMEIVGDLFVAPKAQKAARDAFLTRRKIEVK